MSNERKNHQNIDLSLQTEVLPNNVDKDVQSMFLPFTVFQTLLLSPKYRIKNDVITANNLLNKVLLLCGTVFCMFLFLFRLIHVDFMRLHAIVKIQFYSTIHDFCYHFFGFFVNFMITLIQADSNVLFILTIQQVHRFLNNENSSRTFIRNSWITVAMIIFSYIIFCCFNFAIYPNMPFYLIVQLAILIHFDANIVYAIRSIKLLEDKVILWNHQVLHSFNDNQDETHHERLFQTYLQILKSYQIYKNISQPTVLYFTVHNLLHTLIYVQMLIEFYQILSKPEEFYVALSSSVLIYIWIIKNLMLQTILSQYCEAFYIAVEDSQDICAYILMSNCTDEDKKLCKNVRRVHRTSFSKMRACRLFYVDVCLLLHLAELLSNYTVVLLQFAFL